MSTATSALERFERWLAARDQGDGLPIFRRVFAAIWVLYDVIDLGWGMTERSRVWFPHDRDPKLATLQAVLIASGAVLALGRYVWVSGMIAAAARATEAFVFFPLNDFFFVSVVYLLLAHSEGGPFAGAEGARPRWVREALVFQLGWIYVTTGVLKLNPDWLDGGQLFVRTQYLSASHGWPYPHALVQALSSLAFDAKLSKVGAAGEIALGVTLLARGPYWLAAALAIAIHGFGALITNVWFFTAAMTAGVLLLTPRAGDRRVQAAPRT